MRHHSPEGTESSSPPIIGSSRRPEWGLAVVMGAGGLGMAVARRLGQSYRLMLCDGDASRVQARGAALVEEGYDAVAVRCDVTDAEEVAELAGLASEQGPIQVLANVVGLSPGAADFRRILEVNLCGAARVRDAFLPLIAAGSCAVFVSSIAGRLPVSARLQAVLDEPLADGFADRVLAGLDASPSSLLAYQLSKAAVTRMCRIEARAWGARAARIVSISPGLIASPMGAAEFQHQPQKHGLLSETPLGREGTMLEVANVIAFLASDGASFVSGTDIVVDGGLTAALERAIETGRTNQPAGAAEAERV